MLLMLKQADLYRSLTMSNIVAIGVTKRKNGPLKLKFTENLKARLRKCTPLSDFEIINFVELPQPSTKLQALEFLRTHNDFQEHSIRMLVETKYLRYRNKERKYIRKCNLTQTSVSDVLNAVNV